MAAYGLYTHIRSNRIRSVLLIAGLFLLVYLLTFAGAIIFRAFTMNDAPLDWILIEAGYDLRYAAPFATAGTLLWLLIAYRWHQWMIDRQTGAKSVTRIEEPKLYNLLENLCISRGIPMPKLKITEDMALNAYATGLNEKQYTIAVTRGLVNRLDDPEIEAVLAHELTHIRNGDVRILVIAVVMAGIISFIGEMTFRILFRSGSSGSSGSTKWGSSSSSSNRKGGGGALIAILIALAIIALAWILSILIRYSLSRSREYLADAGAVELTKNPDAMIVALRKIENRGELRGATSSVMEMCFDNPHSGFADLFSTHPTIDKRIEALTRLAGGTDPGPLMLPGFSEGGAVTASAEDEVHELPRELDATKPWGRPMPSVGGDGMPQSSWDQTDKPNPWRS